MKEVHRSHEGGYEDHEGGSSSRAYLLFLLLLLGQIYRGRGGRAWELRMVESRMVDEVGACAGRYHCHASLKQHPVTHLGPSRDPLRPQGQLLRRQQPQRQPATSLAAQTRITGVISKPYAPQTRRRRQRPSISSSFSC